METKKLTCAKCGYEWESRVDVPKECPDCKSREWQEKKEKKGKA